MLVHLHCQLAFRPYGRHGRLLETLAGAQEGENWIFIRFWRSISHTRESLRVASMASEFVGDDNQ